MPPIGDGDAPTRAPPVLERQGAAVGPPGHTEPETTPRPDVVPGLLWSSLGVAAQFGGQFALLAVLARLLTPADFGLVSASLILIGFMRMLTEGLIGPALTQRKELTGDHVATAFALSLLGGVTAMIVIAMGAPAVAAWFGMAELTPIVRGLSVIFVIQSFAVVPAALLQRHFRFADLAKVELGSFGSFATVGVILALLGVGAWALVGAHLAQSASRVVLLLRRQPHERTLRVDRLAARDLVRFGSSHTVAGVFNAIALQGDYVIVGRWLSAAALGVYGRAYQLATSPGVLLGTVLDFVLFPRMASFQDDRERLSRNLLVATSLISTLLTPVLALAFVVAPEAIAILLGDGWTEVVVPFRILTLGLVWRTAYKLNDSLAKAAGAVGQRAWRQGVYAAAVVGGGVLGVQWGLAGVATAVLGAILVNYLSMAALSLRITGVGWGPFARAHVRGGILAVVTATVAGLAVAPLRGLGAGDAVVLVAGCAAVLLPALLGAALAPRWMFGDDVRWLFDRVRTVVWMPGARGESMDDVGTTVEFCGLPGAGKSWLVAQLRDRLEPSTRPVAVVTDPFSPSATRATRVTTKLGLSVRLFLRTPSSAAIGFAVARAPQRERWDRWRRLLHWLAVQETLRRREGQPGLHLVDEGPLQVLWSLGLRGQLASVQRELERMPDRWRRTDLLVLVRVTPEMANDRLGTRSLPNSRLDLVADPAARLVELRYGADLIEELVAWWTRISGRPAIVVERLDDETLDLLAARLAASAHRRRRPFSRAAVRADEPGRGVVSEGTVAGSG
jgi:O-antigen/teichoic acid export membrane protein